MTTSPARTAVPAVNIVRAVYENVEADPARTAIVLPDGRDSAGRLKYVHYSYEQLATECNQLASGLQQTGIRRGMRTVLMVKPSFEFFSLIFAMFKSGIVPVMIDPGMGLANLKTCLAEARPEAFVGITKAHLARLALGWSKDSIKHLVTVGPKLGWGGLSLDQVRKAGAGSPIDGVADTRSEEMAALLFTSGSTGVPKGVVYNHGNFVAQIAFLRKIFQLGENEVDLATFPPFALFDPALGMTSVIPDMDPTKPAEVVPANIFDAIERYGVTHMFGSPALLNRISRAGVDQGITLPSLRRVLSAGAPVPYQTLARMRRMLPPDAEIYTPYGATECLPVTTIASRTILEETHELTGQGAGVCIGSPVAGMDVRIIAIDDAPIANWDESLVVPDGTIGEIVVKGPNVTVAYFNRPQSTFLAKIQDGGSVRHRMGDLGYFDAEGRIWFCGRKTHRVITPDETLYTIPCEAVFNTHADVYRCALVGVVRQGVTFPVICVELESKPSHHREQIKLDLLELAAKHPHTRKIRHFLFHPGLPVDIRHNSKIFREKLAVWADKELP
ncbi:MAG TPA: fatty acid CoA ligase family protein [Candidatus Obscuribacterales bacterium]